MSVRRSVAIVGASLALGVGLAAPTDAVPSHAAQTATAYLTISFGRTQWVQTDTACHALPNTVNLGQVASQMQSMGLMGTGNVITSRTPASGFLCWGQFELQPGWDELATLRDSFGWQFVSASQSYKDMTTLTTAQQQAESCGSLPIFQAHGHMRAWGLFAYPNNKLNPTVQANVVAHCFAFGRKYWNGVPNYRPTTKAPWFLKTDSVNGGACNDPTQPCYTLGGSRYRSPAALAALVNVAPDHYYNVQFYRFVTGKQGVLHGPGFTWDCTSSDWTQHWTSNGELYCYNDFLSVIGAIPPSVVVTDPATVATAWGRLPS